RILLCIRGNLRQTGRKITMKTAGMQRLPRHLQMGGIRSVGLRSAIRDGLEKSPRMLTEP
ncbi:MAG: hypothetical protein Q8O60_02570, partial [Deltaproteobacteria bacterium]|nr:hypothetical protein [Deltaproteobacteria bacterium]